MRFVVGKLALGQVFLFECFGFFLSFLFACSPYLFLSTYYSYEDDERGKVGSFTKSKALSQIEKNWVQKFFHINFCFTYSDHNFRYFPAIRKY
jgi:hypothetical protein